MLKHDILNALKTYLKLNPKWKFYGKCIDVINKFQMNNISELYYDECLLESARITILTNINDYHMYLSSDKNDNFTNYLIQNTEEIKHKLLYQLVCVTKYNSIMGLGKKIELPQINFKNGINVIISKQPIPNSDDYYKLDNLYEICGYVLGIEIFNVLKYQRLDRIINFINQGGESTKIYKMLSDYGELINKNCKKDWQKKGKTSSFLAVLSFKQ